MDISIGQESIKLSCDTRGFLKYFNSSAERINLFGKIINEEFTSEKIKTYKRYEMYVNGLIGKTKEVK